MNKKLEGIKVGDYVEKIINGIPVASKVTGINVYWIICNHQQFDKRTGICRSDDNIYLTKIVISS